MINYTPKQCKQEERERLTGNGRYGPPLEPELRELRVVGVLQRNLSANRSTKSQIIFSGNTKSSKSIIYGINFTIRRMSKPSPTCAYVLRLLLLLLLLANLEIHRFLLCTSKYVDHKK